MEDYLNEFLKYKGKLHLDNAGNITYTSSRNYDASNIYHLNNEKIIPSSVDLKNISNLFTNSSIEESINFLKHDSIIKKFDDFYIKETVKSIDKELIQRIMMHNRRYMGKMKTDSIYEKRSFTVAKMCFMDDLYNAIYTIPYKLLDEYFESVLNEKSNASINQDNFSKFVVIHLENNIFYIYSHPVKPKILLINDENNILIEEIPFSTNILEIKIVDHDSTICKYEILVRLKSVSYIYKVNFKNKLCFNLLYNYNVKGAHLYTTKNFIGNFLVCSTEGAFLYNENKFVEKIRYNKTKDYFWKRGIFSDHPDIFIQTSMSEISMIDFRVKKIIKLDDICNKIHSGNENIYPILDNADIPSSIYFCTQSRINFIDLRNIHNYYLSIEHGVKNGPSFQNKISNTPLISLLMGHTKYNNNGSIFTLNQHTYSISKIVGITTENSQIIHKIIGTYGYVNNSEINIFLYDFSGDIYHQIYLNIEPEEEEEAEPLSLNKKTLFKETHVENTPYMRKLNHIAFYEILNRISKNRIIKNDVEIIGNNKGEKGIDWKNFIKNDLNKYKEVSEMYNKWFPEDSETIPVFKTTENANTNDSELWKSLLNNQNHDLV